MRLEYIVVLLATVAFNVTAAYPIAEKSTRSIVERDLNGFDPHLPRRFFDSDGVEVRFGSQTHDIAARGVAPSSQQKQPAGLIITSCQGCDDVVREYVRYTWVAKNLVHKRTHVKVVCMWGIGTRMDFSPKHIWEGEIYESWPDFKRFQASRGLSGSQPQQPHHNGGTVAPSQGAGEPHPPSYQSATAHDLLPPYSLKPQA